MCHTAVGMWHIRETMKALKSDLGRAVLADPQAKLQLRDLLSKRVATESASLRSIRIKTTDGRVVSVTPIVVPKAA